MIDLNKIGDFDQIGALAEQFLTGTGEGKALFGGLFDTLRSEENAAECQPFLALAEEYERLAEENRQFSPVEAEAAAGNAVRRQYAKGGECLHRGYYSPSMLDLVVGGCDRGRLLKTTAPRNYSYEYLFDEDGRLLCVNQAEGAIHVELLRREDDAETGFTYGASPVGMSLRTICKTVRKDGLTARFELASLADDNGRFRCMEFSRETPEYDGEGNMTALLHQHFLPMTRLLTQHRYTFMRDEEGYLSKYVIKEEGILAAGQPQREPQWLPVLARRK